jgi:zinc/manganese transport system permease protein
MFLQLLAAHFVHVALAAATVVAVLAGLVGPLIVARNNAFAVHGIAELGLTGAAGGLLLGVDAATGALLGSLAVGLLLGLLGLAGRDRDTATGALLAAGLGLGVLFLSRLHSYASTGFGLLFGSITAVSDAQLHRLVITTVATGAVLIALWRPLWFPSVDPDVAAARGVPVRTLAVAFPLVLAVTVAQTLQVTGILLILTLLVTPAAAAQHLTAHPGRLLAVSVLLAVVAAVGGTLASLAYDLPPSCCIALLSFAAYAAARSAPPLIRLLRRRGSAMTRAVAVVTGAQSR